MTLNDWYVFAQGASAFLLFLTFVAGAAAISLGLLRDKAEEAGRLAMEATIATARERAAAAEEGTARALADAAAANERAATAAASAADAAERTARVEAEAAKQQERAANAERQLLQVQQVLAPRTLTEAQANTLPMPLNRWGHSGSKSSRIAT